MSDPKTRVYSWLSGMPTGPDVSIIEKTWPDLKQGDSIPYASIAEAIGAPYPSKRFTNVTRAWRCKMQGDRGLVIQCQTGVAFYVATDEQKISATPSVLTRAGRVLRKQRKVLATVVSQDEHTRTVVNHQGRLLDVLERETKKTRMSLIPSPEPIPQVRIAPPVPRHAEDISQGTGA